MAADDVQAQIEALQAQIKELERQNPAAAELPAATAAVAPSAPAEVLAPAPLPAVVSSAPPLPAIPSAPLPAVAPSAPLPVDDVKTCATFDGQTIPCQQPAELPDLGDLFGGLKAGIAVPSFEQLMQLDTLLPLIGGLVVLSFGFVGFSKVAEWLRPDDAASARRKREERERLGVSEWDQEQAFQVARDNWIAVVLIVGFELLIFNLRNVGT